MDNTLTIDESKLHENTQIIAQVEEGKWIFKIDKYGFVFNREDYPDALADDFAQAFVEILEKQFVVTMEKRKHNK